jgi:nucleoside-diphosphate-sugar epimerase
MRILILGGDGYLGWPTAMHFSARGDDVAVLDNFAKRQWELEEGIEPLQPIPPLHRRLRLWSSIGGREIALFVGDLCNHRFVYKALGNFNPTPSFTTQNSRRRHARCRAARPRVHAAQQHHRHAERDVRDAGPLAHRPPRETGHDGRRCAR